MALAYLCTPGEFVMLLSSMGSDASDGELASIRGICKGKIEVISLFDGRALLVDHEDFIDSNEEGEDDDIEIDDDFAEDNIDIDAFFSKRQKPNSDHHHKSSVKISQSQHHTSSKGGTNKSSRPDDGIVSSTTSKRKVPASGATNKQRKLENLTNFLRNCPKDTRGWIELATLKLEEGDHIGTYEALHRACVLCPLSIDESNPISTMNMYIESSPLLIDINRLDVVLLKMRCLIRAVNIARSSYDINFRLPTPTSTVASSSSSLSSCAENYTHLSHDVRRAVAKAFYEIGRALFALENLYSSLGKPSSCLKGAGVAFRICKDLDQDETLEYAESYNEASARLANI